MGLGACVGEPGLKNLGWGGWGTRVGELAWVEQPGLGSLG